MIQHAPATVVAGAEASCWDTLGGYLEQNRTHMPELLGALDEDHDGQLTLLEVPHLLHSFLPSCFLASFLRPAFLSSFLLPTVFLSFFLLPSCFLSASMLSSFLPSFLLPLTVQVLCCCVH